MGKFKKVVQFEKEHMPEYHKTTKGGVNMKKVTFITLFLVLSIILCSCSGWFGYEKYTDIKDYSKAFGLSEIRNREAFELFPKNAETLNVQDFYFEWKLGVIGSADVQFLLSVTYDDDQLQDEIARLRSLADGKTLYDTESFTYEAYVLTLGHLNTSYYALIEGNTVHYVFLQLMSRVHINIDERLLPKGYQGYGEVKNISYSAYE